MARGRDLGRLRQGARGNISGLPVIMSTSLATRVQTLQRMNNSSVDDFEESDSDDENICPLCCDTMDEGDLNFLPCPCGYQICLFIRSGYTSPAAELRGAP